MSALGRGLGSLMNSAGSDGSEETPRVLPITRIRPNPNQPRKVFESSALETLRDSIQAHGVLQPICVRQVDGAFEIVSGERRWRAARLAGLGEIPVVVREDVDDALNLELALIENLQREDLDPIEKARAFQQMVQDLGLTQEQVAKKVGLQRSTVANHLRLLDLPEEVQDALVQGLITMGHAKALLSVGDEAQAKKLLAKVVREELSVRDAERLARPDTVRPPAPPKAPKATDEESERLPAWAQALEDRIRRTLGSKVTLTVSKDYRGQLQLAFQDRAQLERIVQALAPPDQI